MDWLDLLAVQGTLKSLLQHHRHKGSTSYLLIWTFFFISLNISWRSSVSVEKECSHSFYSRVVFHHVTRPHFISPVSIYTPLVFAQVFILLVVWLWVMLCLLHFMRERKLHLRVPGSGIAGSKRKCIYSFGCCDSKVCLSIQFLFVLLFVLLESIGLWRGHLPFSVLLAASPYVV